MKWSSKCKMKSFMVIRVTGLFSNGSFEKRHELWPSRTSIAIPMTISSLMFLGTSCTQGAAKEKTCSYITLQYFPDSTSAQLTQTRRGLGNHLMCTGECQAWVSQGPVLWAFRRGVSEWPEIQGVCRRLGQESPVQTIWRRNSNMEEKHVDRKLAFSAASVCMQVD